MKLFKNHNKRVEKVKEYAKKNKVFVITMIVAVIFLLFNFVFVSKEKKQELNQEVTISDNNVMESGEPAAD